MSFEIVTGRNVIPLQFFNRNHFFWIIVHWIRLEHRTLFAQLTQQISSVSTEQFQSGGGFAQRAPGRKKSTTEKFAAEENEQLLKNVKPQEVNSLVQTPRSDNRTSGNRLRKCLQRFETLEKYIQFTRVCGDATHARRVSIGMTYNNFRAVDRLGCREYTSTGNLSSCFFFGWG